MGVAVAGRLDDIFQSRRARTITFTLTVGASAVVAAAVSDAAPTGIRSLDELYVAVLTALVAFFAGSARRWTWFLPAGVGAALAADNTALVLAAVAIAIGFWSVVTDSRTRTRGALVAGLGTAALMHTESIGFHGTTALVAAAAVFPTIRSGYWLSSRQVKRRARKAALYLTLLVGLIGIGLAVGVYSSYDDIFRGVDLIDEGVVAAQDVDDDAAALRLSQASRHLNSASGMLESWFVQPARALPFVGQNLRAVERLAEDSGDVARVSALAANSADLDALRFTDGRIDPALLGGMVQPLLQVVGAMSDAQVAVDDVRSPWLVAPIQTQIQALDDKVDENLPDAQSALEALNISQGLLGGNGTPRRYLVLFTTPDEGRGRTGFPGNFAELVADNGQVSMPRFGRIHDLDIEGVPGDQRTIADPASAEYLARYARFEPAQSWRNLTMSPDLPTIAKVASELYPQSGGALIDGVIVIDPVGLQALMNFTGDIRPSDLEDPGGLDFALTRENTAQFLLYDQYVQFADRSQRVDFLSDVAEVTFNRLTSQAEMPGPREAIEILDPVVDGGHIQFTTFDPDELDYFNSIGLSGQFGAAENDVVSLVTSNAGGNKIDYFLQRSMRYDAVWDPSTGAVTGKIVATLTNTSPTEGLPEYFIGNGWGLPLGTNRSFVSIYSAYDLSAARIDGQPVALESGRELNRNVYSAFVDIPPGATVTFELDVAGTWVGSAYLIGIPPQPMVTPDSVEVNLTVAGEAPLTPVAGDIRLDGRTLRWTGSPTTSTVVGSLLVD